MSSYIATSDFTEFQDFDTDTVVDTTMMAAIITRASGLIDAYCGRIFTPASDLTDATRYYSPLEDVLDNTLFLDRDLAAATTVTNGDGVVVAASDRVFLPSGEITAISGPFYAIKLNANSNLVWTYDSDSENSITVLGSWTYALTTPDVITHACLRLAQWIYKQRSSDSVSDQPIVMTSGLTIMPAKLPADVVDMLQPYRRVRIGAS